MCCRKLFRQKMHQRIKHVEFFLLECIGDTASVHFWQPASCNSDLTVLLKHTVAPNQTSCLEMSFEASCCRRGLEQQIALPRDSYLQDYFTDLYAVLRIGPPLYFVVPEIDMDPQSPDVDMVCSVSGCNDTSFVNEVTGVAVLLLFHTS